MREEDRAYPLLDISNTGMLLLYGEISVSFIVPKSASL